MRFTRAQCAETRRAGSPSLRRIDETEDDADGGSCRLRVFNAADADGIDVYLTASDTSLSGLAPNVSSASFGATTDFTTLTAGSYRLRVTAAGTRSTLRLDTTVTLASAGAATLLVFPSPSGRLLNATLLHGRADPTDLPNPKARLRYVNGSVGDAAISATLDGSAIGSSVASRSATGYVEVAAGSHTAGALVDGSSHETEVELRSATDSTCAIYGAAGAPKLLLLEDDNRALSDSSAVRLRLVNLVDGGATLALSIDQGTAELSCAPGAASDSTQVTADTVRLDIVDSSGQSQASIASVELVAGAAYTLFALAEGSGVAALLRRDL